MMRAFLARKKTTSKFPKLALLRQGSVTQGLTKQGSNASQVEDDAADAIVADADPEPLNEEAEAETVVEAPEEAAVEAPEEAAEEAAE